MTMPIILAENFRAAFASDGDGAKSSLVANVLIERALRGDYADYREYGPGDEKGIDKQIIGALYLMMADENTMQMRPDVDAFVLKMEHEPRLVDYYEFADVGAAQAFMVARG